MKTTFIMGTTDLRQDKRLGAVKSGAFYHNKFQPFIEAKRHFCCYWPTSGNELCYEASGCKGEQ